MTSKRVILTDVDGVLLDWEGAFDSWMEQNGYLKQHPHVLDYDMHLRYGIERPDMKELIRLFNQSAAIGFVPPLRDAIHYVKKLHEQHGYMFHVITSLSLDPYAQKLRTMNLQRLFGETVFDRFVYLDTGADKDDALAEYKDSALLWVEDKPENAIAGLNAGLDSVLIEHGHNQQEWLVPVLKNWKHVYNYVVGDV